MLVNRHGLRAVAAVALLVVFSSVWGSSAYVPTLWIGSQHTLARLSASDGVILSTVDIGHHHVQSMATDPVNGDLWLLGHRALSVYDRDGRLLHDFTLPRHLHWDDDNWGGMALDHATKTVWLAGEGDLYRLGFNGNLLGTTRLHDFGGVITLDGTDSLLWVALRDKLEAYAHSGELKQAIPLNGHGRVEAMVYSKKLSSLWVLRGKTLYRYTTANGAVAASIKLGHDADDDELAADGSGAVWVAGERSVMRIDGSGATDFILEPVQGLHGHLVSMVADLSDHSVWLVSKQALVHVGVDGTILQTVRLHGHDHDGGRHEGHHGHRGGKAKHLGPVDAAALWVDTIPPTLSFLKPPEAAYVANTEPSLVFHYSDLGSGVNLSSLSLTVNGQSAEVSCPSPVTGTTPVPASGTTTCSLASPMSQGGQTLSATVEDYAGNISKPAKRSFTVDTIPPTITITQSGGKYTNQPNLALQGHLSEAGTFTVNGTAVPLGVHFGFSYPLDLTEGSNTLQLVATDLAGNVTQQSLTIILDTIPPPQPVLGLISVSGPDKNGQVTVTGKAGAVEGGDTVTITDTRTGARVSVTASADGSFVAKLAAGPSDKLSIKVTDEAGNVTTSPKTIDVSNLPPDPSQVAPALSQTESTPFINQVSFLYSGSNPIQTGVQSGAIKPYRVAVIRGQVIDRSGNPLSGVTVSVEGHPELGHTLSRANGKYDLVVDGGGPVVLSFSKKNYLPAWRSVQTRWKNYFIASKVALIKEDPEVTAVSFGTNAPSAVASGSVQTGASGSRQAHIYFPAGTTAEMVMPDGSTQPVSTGDVRATEYTVGPNGPAAMPASLPPTSDYTYAVDLTLDQAETAGASTVKFNQPVSFYVNNFLGFPVGAHIPTAWYDVKNAEWMPINDGRVIKLLDVNTQGEADLDVSGTGAPATSTTLSAMGITAAERTQLATIYKPGATFWRVQVTHFTGYDLNSGGASADTSGAGAKANAGTNKICKIKGCIITAQTQKVAEEIPIVGTPFNLYYSSGRQRGYAISRTADITLTGSTLPPYLKEVDLEVDVAGQVFKKSFTPSADLHYAYTWNGVDAYGRKVVGAVPATVKITYVTPLQYIPIHNGSKSFAVDADNSSSLLVTRGDQDERVTKRISITLTSHRAARASDALGGWNLSVHDSYDPQTRTIYKGSGGTMKRRCLGGCLERFAGDGLHAPGGYSALNTHFGRIEDLAQDGEGDIYIGTLTGFIREIQAHGIVKTVAGGGRQRPATGEVATKALLDLSEGNTNLSVGPDGRLYFLNQGVDAETSQLFDIDSDDVLHYVANIPCDGFGLSMANDGSAYVMCFGSRNGSPNILYKVSPGGSVHPIQKEAVQYGSVFGYALAQCENQNVYFYSENSPYSLKEHNASGKLSVYSYPGSYIMSMSCDENGGLYMEQVNDDDGLTSYGNGILYRRADGSYTRLTKPSYAESHFIPEAGTLLYQNYFYGGEVMYSSFYNGLFIAYKGQIWFVPGNPGASRVNDSGLTQGAGSNGGSAILGSSASVSGAAQAVSSNGSLLYQFNSRGLQTDTLNTITGNTVYKFGYNNAGQLISVTDANGNVTRIVRNSSGVPTEIVAPTGQITSLSLGADGYLSTITNPKGDSYKMTYGVGGLIKSYTDPDDRTETYAYSALGRLVKNKTAAGGGWSIGRTQSGNMYTVTMTSSMGRVSTYQVKNAGTSREKQVITNPDGTASTTQHYRSGATKETMANGTVISTTVAPDPRFNMQAPVTSLTVTTPGGHKFLETTTRAASVSSADNPLSLTSFTQDATVNGNEFTSSYTASSHRWETISPDGRTVVTTVDEQDRPVRMKVPAMATVSYAYNSQGRLEAVAAGSGAQTRKTAFDYYASGFSKGWLKAVVDPLGQKTEYTYDSGGHVTAETLPDGQVIRFGYDAVGNLTSVTPPSRPAHGLGYTAADKLASYTPAAASGAGGDAVHYSYNLDRQLTAVTLPSSKNVSLQYNNSGQLTTIATPSGQYQYGYSAKTGQLASLIAGIDGESLGFSYDGVLPTQTAYSGPVTGTLKATYNNNFQVTGLSVDDTPITYGYDTDGLLTQAGGLAVARSTQNGLVTGTTLDSIQTSRGYDRFGETTTYAVTAGSISRYAASYTYNKDGEITAVSETVASAAKSQSYGYDKNGRLTSVTEDGVTTTYGYDANGNRISINGTSVATYNARDQLLTYGSNNYTWNADGELATKTTSNGTTHYTWNALGELTHVALPDGTTIHYLYDGLGRRIGKEKNGTLVAGYLYAGSRIVAKTDSTGQVTERFVYATRANVPDSLITYSGGSATGTYRIVSNQVGSVREVINAATDKIVQQIGYDVWGNITSDTNPGFQPFAFAGGLYDANVGLVHFGARDYDPETGRWISLDPFLFAGHESNLYEYVIDDPITGIDPNGTQVLDPMIGTILSDDAVTPDPIQPPPDPLQPAPDPLKTPMDQFGKALQKHYDEFRPGIQQPESLPPPAPEEPWWMMVFRIIGFMNNWPNGSLGIDLGINPCPTAHETKAEKIKREQEKFNHWCSEHPGLCM